MAPGTNLSGFFMTFRGRQDLLNLSGFKLQHSKILQGSWTTLRILSWTDFEALCRILTVLQDAGAILWRRGRFVFRSKLDIRYIFKSFHYYSQAPLDKYWKFSETESRILEDRRRILPDSSSDTCETRTRLTIQLLIQGPVQHKTKLPPPA